MDIPEHIFKAYDIRGIYPTDFNEENIVPITRAIYKYLSDKIGRRDINIAIGRDMRISSPSLFEIAKNTFLSLGANVTDIGLVSTPTFYFAVFNGGFEGGIVISASHNPKEYNGTKMVMKTPEGLLKIGKSTGMDDIKKMSLEGVDLPETTPGTLTQKDNVLEEEAMFAFQVAENPQIGSFKVIADAANAMGGTYIDALMKKLPQINLVRMNFELDGNFPVHQPDPMQKENLVDIQKKITEDGADMGLAPDGDGDRLFILDEKAQVVPPSVILSLVATELLKKNPGAKFVDDIKYQLTARKNIEDAGGQLIISKTGHAFITEQIQKSGALFAGEASAHYYFKAMGGGEAQMPVILLILEYMTREKKKLSEITKELMRASESGEINFKVKNSPEILEKLKEKYHDAEINELDGVAMTYPTWRFSVRTSNTEPLLRLNVEQDLSDAENRTQELVDFIKQIAATE